MTVNIFGYTVNITKQQAPQNHRIEIDQTKRDECVRQTLDSFGPEFIAKARAARAAHLARSK